ncbi:unnamed protein product [Ectocarpus sp. 12 AP-2014]
MPYHQLQVGREKRRGRQYTSTRRIGVCRSIGNSRKQGIAARGGRPYDNTSDRIGRSPSQPHSLRCFTNRVPHTPVCTQSGGPYEQRAHDETSSGFIRMLCRGASYGTR